MPLVETRGTEERFAIRRLIVDRGGDFVIKMLASYGIGGETVAAVFFGRPIDEDSWRRLKTALKERLTHE